MRRRTALAIFLSVPAAALAPSVADSVRRTRRRERHHPAGPHDDAGRVPRRRRALRHVVRVHRRGRVGRVDRAAPRRPDVGRTWRRLDAAAPGPGGRARAESGDRTPPARTDAAAADVRDHPRDADRRPRHHGPRRRRRRGRRVGAGERLLPPARRARGARLLRLAAAPCSWPPSSTPSGPATSARAPATARRSWPRSRPTTHGCRCASSASASTPSSASRPTSSCSPTSEPELLAGGPGLTRAAQRGGVALAARRPALGRRHGVGAERDVALLPPARRRGRRRSTTTSPSPSTRRTSRPSTDAGVGPAAIVPVRPAPC